MLSLGLDQTFSGDLQLKRVTKQVKNERQVNVGQVNETVFFGLESFFEVLLKLPAIVPRIVNMGRQLLGRVQERVSPSISLRHLNVETV